MRKRKIFIELEVPRGLSTKLLQRARKWQDLPVKWTKEGNFHLTLAFLGYVDEEVLPDICEKVRDAVNQIDAFDVYFEKICLGPDKENPQNVWLEGPASDELKNLIERIEKSLNIAKSERKQLRPHVTLGRIRHEKWMELVEKPEIDESFNVSIPAEVVFVMESNAIKGGPEYTPVEECPLA